MSDLWEFWIDVGGTFTDSLGVRTGSIDPPITQKVLSSGITKGVVDHADTQQFRDSLRRNDAEDFWAGYEIRFLNAHGRTTQTNKVASSTNGVLQLATPTESILEPGTRYELDGGEEAPILAIRKTLRLSLGEPIDNVSVKLGTTRGTNALLTRQGARTAFVTTKGFKDVLLIGNQDRPRLFDLAIKKPTPLFEQVVEIDERISTDGEVLSALDHDQVLEQLVQLKKTGVESLAICLLHAFANGDHEQQVDAIAREVGFDEISTSSRLSPLIKIVSRGDTTVMDAYLNPILREYVKRLRTSLGLCELKMMTSAGGLVDADSFVGKDSILSGPAGGVIGFSRVAQRAGFAKSIGFDMGGTSTDVSRFDGEYEMEFETQKAGVRIVSPMLAIETVAAGGGSICGFDGVKLFVGPQSAGADPGPACYGRGGPLTVTDINLYLGRILASRFPFTLDRSVVESQLQLLCEQIANSPLGRQYSPIQLAEGFRQIANANMVRAIRKISVAKGYDPADYALVTFGGAGAQHACAMARSLGIDRVLIHPFAGILSAYGIGLADVRRFSELSILRAFDEATKASLVKVFESLSKKAIALVQDEGIPDERIAEPIRSLELRYRGAESTINVVAKSSERAKDQLGFGFAEAFEEQHQRMFGYVHSGRELEVVAARVEAIGKMEEPTEPESPMTDRQPAPNDVRPAWFDGQQLETRIYERATLQPGDEIVGPAILCEPTSTVVVEPSCVAKIIPRGEILIQVGQAENRDGQRSAQTAAASTFPVSKPIGGDSDQADPVLLEIFNNLFASIAEQMGVTLQKTSFSTNVKERLDFSCAIFTPTGDLVVNAPHIPVHLGAMSETVKHLLAAEPDMQPGDVFVTNDPFRGGSHLPDVTVITPVHSGGELIFFTASRAHHAEIGGIVPGSMPPFSKRLIEEGVLIRNFQLVKNNQSREDELRDILANAPYPSRSVEDNIADVSAQVAANNSGVRLLGELVDRYSLEVVHAYMKHIQRAASEKMRRALFAKPDGVYSRVDWLDDGSPIRVSITVAGDDASVDFTGTGPVLTHSNLNANKAIVTAAVLYVFRCLIDEDIPLNSGVLEPVTIHLPECLLNPPSHDDPEDCVAIVGGNVETSQRVVDVLLGALGVAAASQGTMNNLTFGDETFGYYETICGGSGATASADGADAVHTHMTNTRLTDVEVIERRYPVRVHEFGIRRGSGGSGQHRGGDGIVRRIEFLKPLDVSLLSERRVSCKPFGLQGGSSGEVGLNSILRNGKTYWLLGKTHFEASAGDVLSVETPGGGGFGMTFCEPYHASIDPVRWKAVCAELSRLCETGELPAASMIAGRYDNVVEPIHCGRQTLDGEELIRQDAAFLIASITKPVVAMAVLTLVERGQLTLLDKVIEYIPEFGKKGKNGIRIRHLLTHTSGLPDMLPNNVELREQQSPLQAFVEGTCDCELGFAPGKGVKYQSMGFAILGEIIERVTGITCQQYVQQEIFQPLGMVDSYLGVPIAWFESAGDQSRTIEASRICEIRTPKEQHDTVWNWNARYWRQLGAPWGGMVTTVTDLAKFCQMMLGKSAVEVLSPATIQAATSNQLEFMPDVPETDRRTKGWGLGWRLSWPAHSANFGDVLPAETYGHWGATGTVLWINPDTHQFFVLLTTQPQEPHGKWLARISNMAACSFT